MKAFRNIYVKDRESFPYRMLSGKDVLNYTGKIIYYKFVIPSDYDSHQDIVFDCDCEYTQWRRLNRIFQNKQPIK